MFRFYLNEQIKKYIREVSIQRNKVDVVRDYLKELNDWVTVSINVGRNSMHFKSVKLIPDWEAKCFMLQINDYDKSNMNQYVDFNNNFKIPFKDVLDCKVGIRAARSDHLELTRPIVNMLTDAYDNDLIGYRYEFIKEAWGEPYKNIYKINTAFYDVHVHSPSMYCNEYQLDLSNCETGQSMFVTALELLRGKYHSTSELKTNEDGLLIPRLRIEKYTREEN